MAHRTDSDWIAHCHNTARFFVERRTLAWATLVACMGWGIYGFIAMPQRKDPDIPVRVAVVACQWPGATAQQVEQLITRPIEQVIAQNKTIHAPAPDDFGIQSLSLPGVSFVTLQLAPDVHDSREQFSDINLKLSVLNGKLPEGAGPIQFQSEFGDTAALMLTVASPRTDAVEVQARSMAIAGAIDEARAVDGRGGPNAVSLVLCYPMGLSRSAVEKQVAAFERSAEEDGILEGAVVLSGNGFIAVDGRPTLDEGRIVAHTNQFYATRLQPSEINPDVWPLVIVRDTAKVEEQLQAVAGPKYSYAELDRFTDLIARSLLGVAQTSRVDRKGVLPQAVYLTYSQERLASYGLQVSDLSKALNARNITQPAGEMQTASERVRLDASGNFEDAPSIGDVAVSRSPDGAPVYLRNLVDISRSYQSPATYLNYYTWVDRDGQAHRAPAITLAVFMRSGEQIQKFGIAVNQRLDQLKSALPADLIMVRTSDQPLQVKENIDLFMSALYEAIGLVVLVALIGFWEWRSALPMALSIPITLAMTFGFAHLMRVDLQQVSIASLIIALGLLVDDPVVANDAIKRDLGLGHSPVIAAWMGPSKLARAILYATATNIVAYLPLALLPGTTGDFLWSLPIVMTAALVSSRLVSMTFIPLLGYYLLRPKKGRITRVARN